uniref:N-acetylmuramoyl-L-alanine amidase n=1 Tax=Cyanothece sp. (strain PCC 7425 / ATCC 29141) TaxID=395961 RepID=B8HLG7_CYAP4
MGQIPTKQKLTHSTTYRWVSHSLVWGLLGSVLVTLPAWATELRFWRFDQNRFRLEFRTSEAVQPTAQLIPNPTRLVIDLPGIVLGRPTMTQSLNGAVRSVRVAQFDRQTTRIVIEMAPGYTLDPNQISFQGSTATNWSVQLPSPQLIAGTDAPSIPPSPSIPPRPTGRDRPPTPSTSPQLTDIRVTPDGLYLSTTSSPNRVEIKRSRNRKQIDINLEGLSLAPQFRSQSFEINRFGVDKLQVSQEQNKVRITLMVDPDSASWSASVSRFGGVVLLPEGGVRGDRPQDSFSLIPSAAAQTSSTEQLATITDIALGGNQLLIRSDLPLTYTTGWEGNLYRIRVRGAQLGEQVQEPRLGEGSALSLVRLRQDDPQTISVLVQPAVGVRIQGVNRLNSQSLLLQLQRTGTTASPFPPPVQPPVTAPFPNPFPQPPLPVPSGRRIVVLDPGHGGPDPGAVGIGGLRETDVVLDIGLKVSRLLQQQGILVYLTRTDERDLDLGPRVALAERVNADVFLSIHANAISMSRPDINGVETFYSPGRPRSGNLASAIQNSILSSINMRNRGVKVARFYVTRNTTMPSALVEVGFVTGAEDAPRLANPAWRDQMAQAIARGILQFLRSGG